MRLSFGVGSFVIKALLDVSDTEVAPTSERRLQGPEDLRRQHAQQQSAQRQSAQLQSAQQPYAAPPPQPTYLTEAGSAAYPSMYSSEYSYLSGTSYGQAPINPRIEPRYTDMDPGDSRLDPEEFTLHPRDSNMGPRDPRSDTYPDSIENSGNKPRYGCYQTDPSMNRAMDNHRAYDYVSTTPPLQSGGPHSLGFDSTNASHAPSQLATDGSLENDTQKMLEDLLALWTPLPRADEGDSQTV